MTPFPFDHEHALTPAELVARLGGKGASLVAMTRLGLPVPPGFTLAIGAEPGPALDAAIATGMAALAVKLGRPCHDAVDPWLVSVRSGAVASMPGMLDTLLNVGLTPAVAATLAKRHGAAFADDLRARVRSAATVLPADTRDDPVAQVQAAAAAVLASWSSPRALAYRARAGLGEAGGTAITVQVMVFGNLGAESATGVAFSRDPATGAAGAVGDVLFGAQGEDVVAGTHRPLPLAALTARCPGTAAELRTALRQLEQHYRDLVDVEFTIERGRLWILQARPGKRGPAAAARIAVELVDDPVVALSRAEAVARVPAVREGTVRLTRRDGDAVAFATGLGVSPGLATGRVVMNADAAVDAADAGPVILVRRETSPADVHGIGVAAGVLTATGGALSHAALVAREWGIAAVVGGDIAVDAGGFTAAGRRIAAGEVISIDGTTGEVFAGAVTGMALPDPYAAILRDWAQETAR